MWTERLASTTVMPGRYARHEFSPGNQRAMTLDESDKNIEGSAAEMNGLVRLQQEALLGMQAEGAEPDRGHTGRAGHLVIGWRGSVCLLATDKEFDAVAAIEQHTSAMRG